jgi:hypothetical protein
MELKTKIQRALDIAENALDKVKMRFPRSMHIQTGLLNSMSNIRTRQSQVLKGTSETAILCRIGHKRAIISGELATSVNGSRTRVAVSHASSVEKVDGILALGEQHPGRRASNRNTKEIRKIPKIGH